MNKLIKNSLICSGALAIVFTFALLQPTYFIFVVVALVLTVLISWKYIFEVEFKLGSISEKARFLILPIIFNLGSLYLTTLFFQPFAKTIISVLVIATNYFLWISLRKVHNLSDRAAILHRNILIVIAFLSVYLGTTTVFRLYMLLSTQVNRAIYQSLLVLLIFGLFYIISSFLTWENGAIEDQKKLRPYNVVNSLLGAEVAWISSIWIINYPVIAISEKANLGGTPLPAILLTIVFYFLWGIIFHKLDRSLTRRVLSEYIFIAVIFIAVLLVTAKWLPTF